MLTHSRVESANEGVQPAVQELLAAAFVGEMEGTMSLVRLLGFTTLSCGCVVGRYREVATSREVTYVEEKGTACNAHSHRRNHTLVTERQMTVAAPMMASAS